MAEQSPLVALELAEKKVRESRDLIDGAWDDAVWMFLVEAEIFLEQASLKIASARKEQAKVTQEGG